MLQERALVKPLMVLWGAIDVGSTPLVSSLELTQNCTRWWKIFRVVTSLNQYMMTRLRYHKTSCGSCKMQKKQ